jgi:hypothetical protein
MWTFTRFASLVGRSAASALLIVSALLMVSGCASDDGGGGGPTPTATPVPTATPGMIPDTVPDFSAATFSDPTTIDHPYYPQVPGTTRAYLQETEDGVETIIVEVTDETREVAGVTTRVVRDRVFLDGLIIEDTDDWFAQDDVGNVWYMGEEVDDYIYDDDENLIEIVHEGAWEAGKDVADIGVDALPGYLIKADPMPGDAYYQEYYPTEAEDEAEVLALNVPITLSDESEYSTLQTRDFTALEPDAEELKYYAQGIGVVLEENPEDEERVDLVGIFQTGPESIPDFDPSDFSNPTEIDNQYFPLVPGTTMTYEAETEDGPERIIVEVLGTRMVAGINTRVVRDRVFVDDLLVEDTHDWYAQDDDGNVWYMGEEVDNYNYDDDGELIDIDHEGAWEAGKDVADVGSIAIAGIIMPAQPQPGQSYRQEYYQGEAEDMAYIVRLDAEAELDGEVACEDCLQVLEWNPQDPGVLEYKFHKPGVGVILEEALVDEERVELVAVFSAPTIDVAICAPDAGPFSATLDHPYFSLPIGTQWVLEGEEEDGAEIRVEITSLDETEVVAGVTTRVVEEREWEDGELVEVSRNFFVRAPDGTVCYYGEDVDDYEDGEIVGHEGAWRAGEDGNQPGVFMPADPQVGQVFQQEVAPGIAVDLGQVVAVGESVEVSPGRFVDTIRIQEIDPLDGGTSEKIWGLDVGLIDDDEIERVFEGAPIELDEAEIRIEINDTDGDAGIQIFLDAEGWDSMAVQDPSGEEIFTVTNSGSVATQGVTELFFESAEPSFDEQSLEELLALFPEGEYTFSGTTIDGEELVGSATLTHALPDAPVLIFPEEDGEVDPEDLEVSWEAVADPAGSEIVGYHVVVERDEDPVRVFSADVPADVTSLEVSEEFLEAGIPYKFEVLAIEASGNQTISERDFETAGEAAAGTANGPSLEFSAASIIIEVNDTDGDAGIQIFLDGEGWDEVEVTAPGGETIFAVEASGSVGEQGVTELFIESAEPPFDEVPLEEFLSRFAEGVYSFLGQTTEGETLEATATLTHAIPDGPDLLTPEEDSVVDPDETVVSWNPVADPPGSSIVEYQVIVETEEEPLRVLSMHVPATVNSVTVPPEFLEDGEAYVFEVLAIEASGNQTISEGSFETEE